MRSPVILLIILFSSGAKSTNDAPNFSQMMKPFDFERKLNQQISVVCITQACPKEFNLNSPNNKVLIEDLQSEIVNYMEIEFKKKFSKEEIKYLDALARNGILNKVINFRNDFISNQNTKTKINDLFKIRFEKKPDPPGSKIKGAPEPIKK